MYRVCSTDAALRRSIPAFNKDMREVQTKLEDVAFKLRIPQRKPWAAMVDDVKAASNIVAQPDKVRARMIFQYEPRGNCRGGHRSWMWHVRTADRPMRAEGKRGEASVVKIQP